MRRERGDLPPAEKTGGSPVFSFLGRVSHRPPNAEREGGDRLCKPTAYFAAGPPWFWGLR